MSHSPPRGDHVVLTWLPIVDLIPGYNQVPFSFRGSLYLCTFMNYVTPQYAVITVTLTVITISLFVYCLLRFFYTLRLLSIICIITINGSRSILSLHLPDRDRAAIQSDHLTVRSHYLSNLRHA